MTSLSRGTSKFNYQYDSDGRLISRAFPDGRSQAYSWGSGSLLASTTLTHGTSVNVANYTWDASGNVASITRSNGPTTTYAYNAADDATSIQTKNGTTTVAGQSISWNAGGRPVTATTTHGTTTRSVIYGYDDRGQVTSVCSPTSGTTCGSSAPKTTYSYDLNGNRASVVDSTGALSSTSTFNSDDQQVQTVATAGTTNFTYSDNGALASSVGPSATATYDYGLDGNLYGATL